jgi:N-acetylmuramoyl-L-alanine amidase
VARGADTARFRLATVELTDLGLPVWGMLGADASPMSDTDRVVVARAAPAGGYSWFLIPGTAVEVTGRNGDFTRIRLDASLEAWVNSEDIGLLPPGYASPRRSVSSMQVVPAPGWVDVVIPTGERPPHAVEVRDRALVLTLYGTTITPGLVRYLENDSLVRNIVWEQEANDRARLTIHLSSPPFGYLAMWERGAFVLRVRRPPVIDASAPLRGLTLVVDPGHPPAGATGPTGLYEGDAVLPVGLQLRDLLTARGATVIMTRTELGPVALTDRPVIARRADAHALLSIHLNALPDGVNPFRANGASVLFFHPHSEPLARLVQRELVRHFGIRDLGIHFQNVALARPTWMPAILAEGLFIMMPEQEAAIRSPAGQAAYARALADGVEAFFRARAPGR